MRLQCPCRIDERCRRGGRDGLGGARDVAHHTWLQAPAARHAECSSPVPTTTLTSEPRPISVAKRGRRVPATSDAGRTAPRLPAGASVAAIRSAAQSRVWRSHSSVVEALEGSISRSPVRRATACVTGIRYPSAAGDPFARSWARSHAILGPPWDASMLTPVRVWTSPASKLSPARRPGRRGSVHPDDARSHRLALGIDRHDAIDLSRDADRRRPVERPPASRPHRR